MYEVIAPVSGQVVPLNQVSDQVFAVFNIGDGIAIRTDADQNGSDEVVKVICPINGVALRVLPHATIITTAEGNKVLLHLGFDTAKLNGVGFKTELEPGQTVAAGDPIMVFSPSIVKEHGLDPMVTVVFMETQQGDAIPLAEGLVKAGEPLLRLKRR